MTNSKINKLMEAIKMEGFDFIGVHNCNVQGIKITSEKAQNYFDEFYNNREYILGQILASTENLESLDYDIVFFSLEYHFGLYGINSQTQKELHELNEEILLNTGLDASDFIEAMKEIKSINKDFKNRVYDEINALKKSVIEELKEMLEDIQNM